MQTSGPFVYPLSMGQKKRATKTSKGIHGGGGKTTLTYLQKALMGKGIVQSYRPLPVEKRA